MKLNSQQYAEALFDSLNETAAKDHEKVLDNFVEVLAKNGQLKMYDEIAEEFQRLELKAKGQILANVTTAEPLSGKSEKDLIKELNRLVNGKVELKTKVDKGIIGGVVVRMEDTIIDASVKRNLEDLKNNLAE